MPPCAAACVRVRGREAAPPAGPPARHPAEHPGGLAGGVEGTGHVEMSLVVAILARDVPVSSDTKGRRCAGLLSSSSTRNVGPLHRLRARPGAGSASVARCCHTFGVHERVALPGAGVH